MAETFGISSNPAADRLRSALEPILTEDEQRNINRRIGSALLATGLLIVGWLYARLFPDQKDVADVVLFAASIVAAAPVFRAAVRGLSCRGCQLEATIRGAESEACECGHEHDETCCPGHAREHAHAGHGDHAHNIMDQLVSIAVLSAIATGEYETAILVPLLLALGHFLEERSVLGARAAIEGLKRLRARSATRVAADGTQQEIELGELRVGDIILVRPGEVLPADGSVIEGHSAVDQSAVTGESVPEDVGPGSPVFAGTVNVSGLLRLQVTSLGEETAMGRVLDTLRAAEQSRAPITQLLERYSGYYMPLVLVAAVVVVLLTREVGRGVALLVVACPCALVLSSSTAMVASLALASRWGILIKNTRFLEVLSEVRTMVLDKTGTVTLGHLDVVGARPLHGGSERLLFETALYCAHGSRHPISRAICRDAEQRGITITDPQQIVEQPGKGVEASVDGHVLRLGSPAWLEVREQDQRILEDHVGPSVWASRDGEVLGAILLADRPRPEARAAVEDLRSLGIRRMLLLTGDRPEVARHLAEHLGVDEYFAGMLPTQKLEVVEAEGAGGQRVLAVGDGINDAPALARADVGVAMGAMGSDAAIQSADIALMSNDIRRIGTAIRLSRITRRTINTNVAIGVGTALVMIVLAALGYVGAIVGVLLHNVGSVAVVFNSARLLRLELGDE